MLASNLPGERDGKSRRAPGALVEDLAACRKKIVEAGGRILVEEQQATGMGSFCLFEDSDKRVMGIWKAAAPG